MSWKFADAGDCSELTIELSNDDNNNNNTCYLDLWKTRTKGREEEERRQSPNISRFRNFAQKRHFYDQRNVERNASRVRTRDEEEQRAAGQRLPQGELLRRKQPARWVLESVFNIIRLYFRGPNICRGLAEEIDSILKIRRSSWLSFLAIIAVCLIKKKLFSHFWTRRGDPYI